MAGGVRGREGGGMDLNLGTPDPVRSAMRSDRPHGLSAGGLSWVGEARRSEKEVVMNGRGEKVKVGWELAEVSRLPEEDAIRRRRKLRGERRRGKVLERERKESLIRRGGGEEDGHVLHKALM